MSDLRGKKAFLRLGPGKSPWESEISSLQESGGVAAISSTCRLPHYEKEGGIK